MDSKIIPENNVVGNIKMKVLFLNIFQKKMFGTLFNIP